MSVNRIPPPPELDAQPHTPEDIQLLFQLYKDKRIEGQLEFYENRSRENALNSDFTFTLGTFVMTLSSLLATISASAAIPVLALISAILPAFSALLAAFRQLYGWDRQSAIYRDAVLGLQKLLLMTPDDDRLPYTDVTPIFSKLINSSEAVFTAEVSQWGQIVLAAQQGDAESQAKDPLARLIESANLSPDQMSAIQSIVTSGQTGVSLSAITTTRTDVKVDAPAAGSESTPAAPPAVSGQFSATTATVVTAEPPPVDALPEEPTGPTVFDAPDETLPSTNGTTAEAAAPAEETETPLHG
ncbi:MAG: SLATT domain-containing protein [Chloroflexi bacterium]|nr:SLATT domain-containing protein [Chloroflexota bacterium]